MTKAGVVALAIGLLVTAPAVAQPNCAKPSSEVDLAICAMPELAATDRQMVAAYDALAAKLSGPAREHLVKDQQNWLVVRAEACVGNRDDVIGCIKRHDQTRLNNLQVFGEGVYPFISGQALIKSGKVGRISYTVDAAWPRFDGTTADFSDLNRQYATTTQKAADQVIPPDTSAGERRGEQVWPYIQTYELQRPSADAISVAISSYAFAGGAHGYGGTSCSLVDLRSGRKATLNDVFGPGDRWLQSLIPLVQADLKKQFTDDRPGFNDALEPASLAKMLRDPSLYCFQGRRLQLIFNPYAVGPYVSGTFKVNIAYDTLKALFAAGGPLAPLR